jgi:thiamine biosynthesis lipoprotein
VPGAYELLPVLKVLVLAVTATVAAACRPSASTPATAAAEARPDIVERSHQTMGSELRLTAWTADARAAVAAFESVFAEFDRLDDRLSVWKPGSDVQRLNLAAGIAPVSVGPDAIAVLAVARDVGDWTGGKFDVTFGALSDLWRFDHDQDNRIPAPVDLATRLDLVDYHAITLDAGAGTAFLARAGMRVHLGGIGKGYAVDRAVEMLRARGLPNFLVQSGGDLYASGQRGDRPWRVGIRDPRGPETATFASLDLRDATFSTSGDYERFFLKDGRRYHHILDPDLGEPARGSRSVTIVADRAILADALSTGVFVLGPEQGMALIERLPGVEGVIVTAENEVLVSSGLTKTLQLVAPPTDAP